MTIWRELELNENIIEGQRLRITRLDNGKKSYARAGIDHSEGFIEVTRPNQKLHIFCPRDLVEVVKK